jgi:hypothetical protein
VYINSEYSHLIVVYDYKNLVIYSSLIPDTELYQEKDIFPYTLSISQVIFDANMEFLILINSDVIYKYYYPSSGNLIN